MLHNCYSWAAKLMQISWFLMLKENLHLKTYVIKIEFFSSVSLLEQSISVFQKANSPCPLVDIIILLHGLFYLHQDMPSLSLDLRPCYHFFPLLFPTGSVTRVYMFNYLKLNPILTFFQIYYFFFNINMLVSNPSCKKPY